jgi:protein-tyrosine phosphatase
VALLKIDFHSHILPGIDDGSRSVEESLKILDVMAEDGVDIVVATPHFYCSKTSIHRFLDKRNAAFEKLKAAVKPEHPKILLGAEVLYNHALVGKDALTRLAIQGTEYLLLEMPYKKLTPEIIEDVDKIACDFDVKVLIAHAERYLNFTSMKSLCSLMDLNVLGQINCTSLTKMSSRRDCFKLIKSGYVQVLGTDFHRIDRGDATLGEGIAILEKKFGPDFIAEIEENSKRILSNRTIDEVLS